MPDALDVPNAAAAPGPRARALAAAARAVLRLPAPARRLVGVAGPEVVDGQTLDPDLQLICALQRRRGGSALRAPEPAAARRRFRHDVLALAAAPLPVGPVRDLTVDGAAGPLRARHYAPPGDAADRPLLVYLHGGGFVIGDLDTHDAPCRRLCRGAATHVLSVDYRLAPEHPFPAALDDAAAALAWARANARALGADPARVAVGGDSAGGNLAAGAARLAARAGRPPAAQLLVYPVTGTGAATRSQALFSDGYFLSVADRRWFSAHYLAGAPPDDPRAAPLCAPDLGGLPPALVVTAGFDILRDEGAAYAEALRAAGTPAELLAFPGLGHGFLHLADLVPGAARAVDATASAWRALVDAAAPAHR